MTAGASINRGRRSIAEALFWAIFLSVFFFAIYCPCSAVTARRSDVGTYFFAWEMHIPFVPVMVIPYMSIDLFFFFAPFFCRSRGELRVHAGRVITAIFVAGICFLLFPLKAGFNRPAVHGFLGDIFRPFWNFDRPYNLAPSLHIALWLLLWAIYIPRSRGIPRGALLAWFLLIPLSTVLTHQHQMIDIVTGFFLAAFCFALFPGDAPSRFDPPK